MFNIDFSTLPDISKKLSGEEISSLNTLFQDSQIQSRLEEIEQARKTRAKWKWGVYGLTLIIALGLSLLFGKGDIIAGFFYTIHSGNDTYPITIIATIGIYSIAIGFLYKVFSSKIEIPLKSEILAKLCPILYSKLEYSYDAKYSFDELETLLSKDFISSYDQIDRAEDSVHFSVERDGKKFVLNGFEVETSEVRGSGKSRKRVTTNHDYLMKVQFPHARIPLQSDMFILQDGMVSDSKTFFPIVVGLICFLPSLFLSSMGIDAFGIKTEVSAPIYLGILFGGAFLLSSIVAFITYLFTKNTKSSRVKLENIAFEKLFDVECEDQVTSRMIITPAFMDRLVSLVEKTGNQYQFLFQQNVMYVKRSINGNYLEAGTERDVTKNLSGFLQFYIDMREICLFANDMNLLYLSKTDPQTMYVGHIDTSVIPISSVTSGTQQGGIIQMIKERLVPKLSN